MKLLTKRVFCFCSRNEFHETSFLPLLTKRVLTKRVLTKRVFLLCSRNECSRNECSRNEFKTREQISLKDLIDSVFYFSDIIISILCSRVSWANSWALLLTKLVKLLTKRVFCFCSRNEFHETSFLPLLTKRVLTKRVFEHCSRNECSRNEFKTREQISLKDFLVRWNFQFSTCAPCSNIVHITNSQCSTIMITWFFVLGFLEVVTGDARLRRPQGLKLSLEPEGTISVVEYFRRQSFCQCSYFSWLFFPSFSSYVATLKICSFVKNLNAHN